MGPGDEDPSGSAQACILLQAGKDPRFPCITVSVAVPWGRGTGRLGALGRAEQQGQLPHAPSVLQVVKAFEVGPEPLGQESTTGDRPPRARPTPPPPTYATVTATASVTLALHPGLPGAARGYAHAAFEDSESDGHEDVPGAQRTHHGCHATATCR